MFASSIRRCLTTGAAITAIVMCAACADPLTPFPAPEVNGLRLFMVLDPDQDTQMMTVAHTAGLTLPGLHGTVSVDGREIASHGGPDWSAEQPFDVLIPCIQRYGTLINSPQCLTFTLSPEHGTSYDIRVIANDRPAATATTTIPGAFSIVSHDVAGSPPGTERLRVTWTRSTNVYRYVVAIRGTSTTNCVPDRGCHKRWFAVTADTTLDTVVSADYFEKATGPWFLDVYAMNEELFTHLMTGTSAPYFPVSPAQNVRGGFGAVGAWVRRAVALD